MTAQPRHIGGSILPSSDPFILSPMVLPFGTLQVRPIVELDTHGLFHAHDRGETLLATHPNGYSCRALAERMAAGDEKRVRDQAEYIQACGGTTRHHDHIVNSMKVRQ